MYTNREFWIVDPPTTPDPDSQDHRFTRQPLAQPNLGRSLLSLSGSYEMNVAFSSDDRNAACDYVKKEIGISERRLAEDGDTYVCADFIALYGIAKWNSSTEGFNPADMLLHPDVHQMIIEQAERRRGPDGHSHICDEFLAIYGDEQGPTVWAASPVVQEKRPVMLTLTDGKLQCKPLTP